MFCAGKYQSTEKVINSFWGTQTFLGLPLKKPYFFCVSSLVSEDIQQLSKHNPADAVADPHDAEELGGAVLAEAQDQCPVSREGEGGEYCNMHQKMGKKQYNHCWGLEYACVGC